LDPKDYLVKEYCLPFENCNEKWFTNLSQFNIPTKVQRLLQLCPNFSLPTVNSSNNIVQLIKNIENNIIKLDDDTQNATRNLSIPLLHKLKNSLQRLDIIDNKIFDLIKHTNKFIKNNLNIIFTRADKGNITVALDKQDYINNI